MVRRAVSNTSEEEEQVQKDNEMLVLDDVTVVVVAVVPGSLVKEAMPSRQRGHGTEPGVACDVVFEDVMVVVLRYNAQFVQNS